ncbi:MAG: CotH kinase family protein, partial [Lachnospiraceae bacterium]|nr:CotH kinase family protein [Lachnospiraceae bacterium]
KASSAAETTEAVETAKASETQKDKENKDKDKTKTDVDYESRLFDTSYVHTIDIQISEEDWTDLNTNPTEKTKYKTTVTVDGETFEAVSFATKGNTSLSSIASDPDSNRYSFKLNFGKYNKGQTYYGLKKLNLNNLYADATYMKDYLSYEIFREAGVESSLTSYVWLTINGEDQGLYIAIEDISESYLDRVADGEGELYKPETEMLGNMGKAGGQGDFNPGGQSGFPGGQSGFPGGQGGTFPGGSTTDPSQSGFSDMPQGGDFNPGGNFPGGFSFGSSSNGADLVYKDDEISSYSDIFDNAETDVDEEDEQRVIAALKALSQGDVSGINTDQVIRYFAAHNFVLNYDSYTGSMLHNYYLYENDGQLSMLPWDYNLAFGGFSGGDATSLINTGIDTPLSGSTESARPMWSWIASDETYLTQYHEVYEALISGYFESGRFEQEIDALYEMLLPYVEKDPSAFYTAEEFTKAVQTLKEFCLLRAESIRRQLDGTLSTKTSEQKASDQVDASSLSVRDMGSQGGGNQGGGNAFPGGFNGGYFNSGGKGNNGSGRPDESRPSESRPDGSGRPSESQPSESRPGA